MKPTYAVRPLPNGDTEVRVTAHPMFAKLQLNGPVLVTLTRVQYARFKDWRGGRGMIQDMLPDLSVSEREMLMSGLDDASFKAAVGGDSDDTD